MKKIITILLSLLLLSSCADEVKKDAQKLQIFTSFYVVESFAKTIGGDKVEVTNLAKNGSVHDFDISAKEMASVCDGDLFLYMGGADHWAEDVANTATNDGCKTLALCDDFANTDDYHIWLSPDTAQEQMEKICTTLSQLSPKDKTFFENNLKKAAVKYDVLREKIASLRKKTKGKTIVVLHGAYGHLCKELEMEQRAIEGIHGDSDPTAASMAQIMDFIKANNIKHIFVSPNENPKTAQTVARETGCTILQLDSMETQTQSGSYFDILEQNLLQIEKAVTAQEEML